METKNSLNGSNLKTPDEIHRSIFDIKEKIYQLISDDNLKKRIKYLERLYEKTIEENTKNINVLMKKFKNKEISLEDFQKQRQTQEQKITDILSEIGSINDELTLREIIRHNSTLKINDDIIKLCENIDDLLGENIMNGGSNAIGVFEVLNTNYVLIKKSIGSFKYLGDLAYYYEKIKDSTNIPKVKNVFIKDSQTYLLMERASGKQVDRLSIEEIENIPQKHFDDFVKNLKHINEKGLCIDPSKRSNFFYDENIGFIFIDLQVGINNISYNNLEYIVRASILGNTSNFTEEIKNKINKATT